MVEGKGGAPGLKARGRIERVVKRLELSPRVGLTLLVGAAGALLAHYFALPGGMLIGALGAAAVARLLGCPLDEVPKWLRTAGRIVLGLTIGATVTPSTLQSVVRALLPVSIAILAMIAFGLLTAYAIRHFTHMPLPTALCSTTPGALGAMIALADDLGGDGRVAASMQLVRLLGTIAFVPLLVRALFGVGAPPAPLAPAYPTAGADALSPAILLVLGLLAGVVAVRLKAPGGDILAGLVVAAVANPAWLHLTETPVAWSLFAQWTIGAGVGATVTRAVLRTFRPYTLAGVLMAAFLIAAGLGLGWALSQVTGLDLVTCIAGCAPGGADTMIILAGDLGADAQLVTSMHLSRQIILMFLLPVLARIAAGRSSPAGAVTPRV